MKKIFKSVWNNWFLLSSLGCAIYVCFYNDFAHISFLIIMSGIFLVLQGQDSMNRRVNGIEENYQRNEILILKIARTLVNTISSQKI